MTLYRVPDSVGIAVVQEALVFRLVWAIEAVRTILTSLDDEGAPQDVDERAIVALCIAYGVPSVAAARLLESGLESRLLVVRLARELALAFTTRDELLLWLLQLDGQDPLTFSEPESEALRNFIRRNDKSVAKWVRRDATYSFSEGEVVGLKDGAYVRLLPNQDGIADVYTPDFQWVRRTESKVPLGQPLEGTVESQKNYA